MNDSYVELLIRQKATKGTVIKKAAVIAGMVICAMFIILFSAIWLLGIFGLVYLWKRVDIVEFEYVYCNGEVDIDKIMGMQSR